MSLVGRAPGYSVHITSKTQQMADILQMKFQINFFAIKVLSIDLDFTEVCLKGPDWQ